MFLPDAYTSTASVKLQVSGADPGWIMLQDETKAVLSPEVLSIAIKQLNLNERWGRKYFQGETLKTSEVLQILTGRIKISPVQNSSLITIQSYSDNPDESALVANAVADAFQVFTEENQTHAQAGKLDTMQPSAISVQIIEQAQPPLRPFKPNRPICIIVGIFLAVIYAAIATVLAVGARLFVRKLFAGKTGNSNNLNSPSPTVKQIY